MRVFAVELCGQAVQAAAQSILVDLHQLLAFGVQLHADAKLALPVQEKDALKRTVFVHRSATDDMSAVTCGREPAGATSPDVLDDGSVRVHCGLRRAASCFLVLGIGHFHLPFRVLAFLRLTADVGHLSIWNGPQLVELLFFLFFLLFMCPIN